MTASEQVMMKIFQHKRTDRRRKGQSFVEFAVFLPIFLIMVSGLAEFGFLFNDFLNVMDGPREGARFAADLDFKNWSQYTASCPGFANYKCPYFLTISKAVSSIGPVTFNPGNPNIDVVVSLVQVDGGGNVAKRVPSEAGFNYGDLYPSTSFTHASRLNNAKIHSLITTGGAAIPGSSGFVLVEIFYKYKQHLGLPWITVFVPDPIPVYSYTMMPYSLDLP
jgi:hypothetical protein